MKVNIILFSVVALSACGQSDLRDLQREAIDVQRAADNNPFAISHKPIATNETKPENDNAVAVDEIITEAQDSGISVTEAQEIANTVTVVEEVVEPVTVVEEVEEVVTVVEEVVEPVTVVEEVEEVVTFDPDGETVFTYQEYSGNWNPRPSWVDSYSVGNRCYMHTGLDHGADLLIVDTPYGPRSLAAVQQLIGDGPGIGDNPQYNDVQCGNGPANDYGDEDRGECPGRIDQGRAGCGTIGPKWYFEQ